MTTSPTETASATRPGVVTAAAVLAFLWGGLTIVSSLLSMAASSLLGTQSASQRLLRSGLGGARPSSRNSRRISTSTLGWSTFTW